MTDLHRFQSFDGVSIGYRTLGDPAGWPILMLHGFLASAESNWFLPGIAAAVAATGRRVIAPDLRGHGRSDAPTDPAAWPRDVLARDQEALIAHLHLRDNDNGSADTLAAMMADARAVRVPGDHLSAVMEPALAEAVVGFLEA